MGGEALNDASAFHLYTEYFERQFPLYLAYGMSTEEYWDGDPQLAKDYRKAYDIRRSIRNQELWLQGFYVYQAIGAFAEILPAFPKKGAKIETYLSEPVPITEAEIQQRKEEEQRRRTERLKASFMKRALAINARMPKEEKSIGPID